MKQIAMVLFCAFFYPLSAWSQETEAIPGDFDANGQVEFADFLTFASGFGKTSTDSDFDTRLDLGGNGTIDFEDFLIFAANFGKSSSGSQTPTETPTATHAYIADILGGSVRVLDLNSNLVAREIPVVRPKDVAYSNLNQRIYIVASDTFHALTTDGERIYSSPVVPVFSLGEIIETPEASKMVLTPDHKLAFVTERTSGVVAVIETESGESVKFIPVPPLPNDIEITPDGKTIYVAHGFGSEDLSVIEPISQTRIEGIPVPSFRPYRVTLSQDGQKLYLNSKISPRIAALDLASKVLTDSLEVGEPDDFDRGVEGIALSQDGTRLYATVSRILPDPISQFAFSGVLWIIDTATFTKIGEILIGELIGTISISPDGKTAYIAGAETLDLTVANQNFQVFLVDLEDNTNLGPLRGFFLPVAIEFGAGKPALPRVVWPEIVVF